MTEIRPFRGVHYNQSRFKDLASVICPPYDIIAPQMQQELYQRSEYNFVRLEFGRELPQDTEADNKYTRSSAILEQWLGKEILHVDSTPAIYLHDHHFIHQGKRYKRRGMIVLVRLKEWSEMVVRPHEGTLTKHKGDRLNLLWSLQANVSPIMALFEDQERTIASLLDVQEQNKPLLRAGLSEGESHDIWAITDDKVVGKICRSLAEQPIYIADGHHRYESALTYLHERRACSSSVSGDEPFNFVMVTLVDFADPGLVILPAHRLVCGVSRSILDGLMARLKVLFEIEELPLNMPDVWQRADDLLAVGENQAGLTLFGPEKDRLFVLKLQDFVAASHMMPYFHTDQYKRLDNSVVDHVILEELLGLSTDKEETRLAFNFDRQDAINKVLAQEYQLAFILRPVKADVIKSIADVSDRMPRKSTYFFPKTPAGLVFHRLV